MRESINKYTSYELPCVDYECKKMPRVRCDYCGRLCKSYSAHVWNEDFCFGCFIAQIIEENFTTRKNILDYFNKVCDYKNDAEFLREITQMDDKDLLELMYDEEVDTLAEYCGIEWSVND